ncbi:MAG: hypothetical protein LIO90_11015 [Bacteroidales bacterium]|nr:hypothetical protein [Bacteroidales bacterium]
MLDGKHFFNGNNQLMLENIGAYTVKDIKIYDKVGEASEFAGRNLGNDKELVMDVRLKKEYATGLIANIEGGIGTDSRYLGRLLGMWFTADTRLTLYVNSNNLNDDRKPGKSDSWTPADLKTGVTRLTTGGLDYSVDKKMAGWKANGDIVVKHSDLKDHTGIYRTNFLAGGDTYDRIFHNNHYRNLSINTKHLFYLKRKAFDISINPRLEYGHRNNSSATAAITLLSNVQDITFENLVDFGQTPGFLTDYINRYTRDNLSKGNTLTGSLSADTRIKLSGTSNIIRVGINATYSAMKDDRFERYYLSYSSGATAAQYYDRYFKNHPNHTSRVGGHVGYNMHLTEGITFELTYRYAHNEGKTTSELFNLHELSDDANRPFGLLPSTSEYLATLDRRNSYVSRIKNDDHTISPLLLFERGNVNGQFNIPVILSDKRLAYHRGIIDTTIVRNTVLLNIDDTFIEWKPNRTKKFTLMYGLQSEAPDLVNMVDMTDTTDPLNIYEGNAGLKNSRLHRVSLNAELMNPAKGLMQYINLKFSTIENALARGYIYESTTGIRRFKTYNVNGNWDGSASYGLGLQFGPGKTMTLQSLTTGSMVRSVDLVGEDDNVPSRSKVTSKGVNEILKWNWGIGKNQIGLNADVTYRRYSATAAMNTWQHKYGMTGLVNITKDLQVSTDFSVFLRSGFCDESLNTTDLVWNTRISYSMLKGSLVAMLDGFDMLHNLSNVTYSVNAQARTETYVNVLPRYFMLHIQYRFNRQPKKRNK